MSSLQNIIHPHLVNTDALVLFSSFSTLAISSLIYGYIEPSLSSYLRRQRAIRKTPISKQKLLDYLSYLSTSLSTSVTDSLVKAVADHERHRASRERIGEATNPLPLVKLNELVLSSLKESLKKFDNAPTEAEAEQAVEHFIESKKDREVIGAVTKAKESHPLYLTPSILLRIHEEKLEAEYLVYLAAKDEAEKTGIELKSAEFAQLLRKKMKESGGTVLNSQAGVEDDGKDLPCMTKATLSKYGLVHKALLWTSVLAHAHDEERIALGGKKGVVAAGIEKLFTLHRDKLGGLGLLRV